LTAKLTCDSLGRSCAPIVREDATKTAKNIASHELIFRLGVASDLLAGISCIFVTLALYQLLIGVDQKLGVRRRFLGGNASRRLFPLCIRKQQRAALAMLFLRLHDHGYFVNEIFAGL
jgi:Domain of unknown function (DUF4386)